MKIKKIRANEKCPCGNRRKHKRCCMAQGLPWFETDTGLVLPFGLARDTASGYQPLPAPVRDIVLLQAADLGYLDDLKPTDTFSELFDCFDEEAILAIIAGVGMSGDIILFIERLGDLPPLDVYRYWKETGYLITRRKLTDEERAHFREIFDEIIDLYAIREKIDTDEGPVSCLFDVAPLLVDVPGLGLAVAQSEDTAHKPPSRENLWPYTQARVTAISVLEGAD